MDGMMDGVMDGWNIELKQVWGGCLIEKKTRSKSPKRKKNEKLFERKNINHQNHSRHQRWRRR